MNQDRSRQLLAARMEDACAHLEALLDAHGENLAVLGKVMEDFTLSVFDLPQGAACTPGCAHCCHLRVGVSIPELLVIHEEILAQTTPRDLEVLKTRLQETEALGNTLDEDFWRQTHPPCPFLDNDRGCGIYPVRPFACRAHHSTDARVCQQGFDEKRQVLIPCFPLYRASTEIFAAVLIKVMADRGFASYQVGFVRGLALLFETKGLAGAWLNREDVFFLSRI